MSVVLETTLGDITIDLFLKERPRASLNFLKLCKIKYFNYNLFHTISRGFIAQTGDPTGSRNGGESIYGVIEGPLKRYFEAERNPRIKHTTMGLVSFVGNDDHMIGSQFFITLGSDLTYLDAQHCIFGEVMEGLDVLELLNETICDQGNRPYQDVRITHTVVLDDPFPDLEKLRIPSRSPSPSAERLQGGRIAPDEEIDETHGRSTKEVNELVAAKEAKARATILEMIGDIPDAEMAPPENVLFVCKLNPVTTDDDLEIIFSRFGKIKSCEVIRDKKTEESLQYAFVEFTDRKVCEDAYFKMDNVLIDDRRIHVDFSQSVAKVKWHGKGRGVTTYDDKGKNYRDDRKNELGNGIYRKKPSNVEKRHADDYPPSKQARSDRSDRNVERRYERKEIKREYDRKKDYDGRSDNFKYPKSNYDSYRGRERSYEQNSRNRYTNQKYVNRYEEKSRDYDKEYRTNERGTERKYGSSSRTTEKYEAKYKNYHGTREMDYKEKGNSKSKSKELKRKKDNRGSSSDDSEDSSSSSSDDSSSEEEKQKKKRKKKRDGTSDAEKAKKQIKKEKKKKSKKKKSDSSSSSDDD